MTGKRLVFIIFILGLVAIALYSYSKGKSSRTDTPSEDPSANSQKANQIYKWNDEQGILHFSNDFDTIPDEYKDKLLKTELPEINTIEGDKSDSLELSGENNVKIGEGDIRVSIRVILYTKKNCMDCVKVTKFLSDRGIIFTPMDIESDSRIATMFYELTKGQQEVPVLVIGKKTIQGYDPHEIRVALREEMKKESVKK